MAWLGFWIGLAAALACAKTIKLSDGTVIQGEILDRTDSTVAIRSQSLGTITIRASELAAEDAWTLERPGAGNRAPAHPGSTRKETAFVPGREPSDQALFFLPTAFTPPGGSFTFRDFELFFLTMGYAPTDATSLTGGFLFPISPDFQVLTIGAKQRLWRSPDGLTAAALTANFTNPLGDLGDDMSYFLNSNLVVGKRTADGLGVHGAVGYLGARTIEQEYVDVRYVDKHVWKGSFTYAFGAEARLTPHAKILAEYLSSVPVGTGTEIDGGLLTVGFRLHGDRLSADIAGTRPIVEDELDGFLLWPLLVVSYRY